MKDSFSKLNPITNLIFFIAVISLSMFENNPVCIGLSFVFSLLCGIYSDAKKALGFLLRFSLPITIAVSVINPIVNHGGQTIIDYLPWGNPLTLESILYGVASAFMLSSVMLWFSFFNKVMTSDKFVYLFGRMSPSLSLILSMTLRFVPEFSRKFRELYAVQKSFNSSNAGLITNIKTAAKSLSAVISWSLESSVETADSMKSRGYGLKKRTSYARYKIKITDIILMSVFVLCAASVFVLKLTGAYHFRYFPSVKGDLADVRAIIIYILFFILMSIPLLYSAGEGMLWKKSHLAI